VAIIDFAWVNTELNTKKGYDVNFLVLLTNPFDTTVDRTDPLDIDATRFEACFDKALEDFKGVEGAGDPKTSYWHDRKAMKELTIAYLWENNPAKHAEHFAKGIHAAKNAAQRKTDRPPTTDADRSEVAFTNEPQTPSFGGKFPKAQSPSDSDFT